MRFVIALIALALAANGVEAQRNCKKGISCGGSCISPSKTCRVGTGSAPAPPSAVPSDTLLSDGRPVPKFIFEGSRAPKHQVDTAHPGGVYDWIASIDGTVYYSRFCLTAKQKIVEDEAVYFRNEDEARTAGYKRSKARGC